MFNAPNRGIKIKIPIAHILSTGFPVSRSEARRLFSFISRFEEATLDFFGVKDIGQAFAHELFVVFQGQNPTIRIDLVNANDNVEGMRRRVENTRISLEDKKRQS